MEPARTLSVRSSRATVSLNVLRTSRSSTAGQEPAASPAASPPASCGAGVANNRSATAAASFRATGCGSGTWAPERPAAAGAGFSRPAARYTTGPMICSSRHRMSQGILLPPLIWELGRR